MDGNEDAWRMLMFFFYFGIVAFPVGLIALIWWLVTR